MLEAMVALIGGFIVFAIFLLAFVFKRDGKDSQPRIHSCANCNCDNRDHHRHWLSDRNDPADRSS